MLPYRFGYLAKPSLHLTIPVAAVRFENSN
jgi:hypothetical protein